MFGGEIFKKITVLDINTIKDKKLVSFIEDFTERQDAASEDAFIPIEAKNTLIESFPKHTLTISALTTLMNNNNIDIVYIMEL